MKAIEQFLSHPIILLLQFLLTCLGFIMAFDRPRRWFEKRVSVFAKDTPTWPLTAGVGSVLISFTIGLRHGYWAGIVCGVSIVALVEAVLLITVKRKVKSLDYSSSRQKAVLSKIRNLHVTRYSFRKCSITMEIDDDGGVSMTETFVIQPYHGKVHFKDIWLGLDPSAPGEMLLSSLKAQNLDTEVELEIVELDRTERQFRGFIVLEPPATTERPVHIIVESKKSGAFINLIQNHKDVGFYDFIGVETSDLEMKFIAPRSLRFKNLYINPPIGEHGIEGQVLVRNTPGQSVARWLGTNIEGTRVTYHLTAEPLEKIN